MEHDLELCLGEAYLLLEVAYNPVAPANRVGGPCVRLEDDGPHGVVFGRRVEVADYLHDVANAEQTVGVQELALAVVGEIRGEDAVGGALTSLVLASGAGLGGGAVAAGVGEGDSTTRCTCDVVLVVVSGVVCNGSKITLFVVSIVVHDNVVVGLHG